MNKTGGRKGTPEEEAQWAATAREREKLPALVQVLDRRLLPSGEIPAEVYVEAHSNDTHVFIDLNVYGTDGKTFLPIIRIQIGAQAAHMEEGRVVGTQEAHNLGGGITAHACYVEHTQRYKGRLTVDATADIDPLSAAKAAGAQASTAKPPTRRTVRK